MNLSKKIGCIMLVVGTQIGAGMLALPLAAQKLGFYPALILLAAAWALMSYTAILVLKVTLKMPLYRNNFSSMAKATLGKGAQMITWIASLCLLYALTSAYIQGMGSLLSALIKNVLHIQVSDKVSSAIFAFVFGSIVFLGASKVDYVNRFLLTLKGIFILMALACLVPHISQPLIGYSSAIHNDLFAGAAPVFITAFAFHSIIPSIVNYSEQKGYGEIKFIILASTSITALVYALWLMCTLGIIPSEGSASFATIMKQHNDVGVFIGVLNSIINKTFLKLVISAFSNIAMTTSFLGVSLSLFDFLADGFNQGNHFSGRVKTFLLTFLPPLACAIFYAKGFLLALNYATIFVVVLQILLPTLMAWKTRQEESVVTSVAVR
jgi:aromatic amino acid transport protein